MDKFTLPQLAWHGVKGMDITLPEGWQTKICNMAGYDKARLKPAAIKNAIASPLGIPPLHEYACGKKEVVVLFDDMSRVTRTAEIVPFVLEELAAAGISDKQIRFICASGCHSALSRSDFAKKLGENVLKRFPVYNHNPFDNCVYAGTTTSGTKVSFNAEVMKCDLKIGIGSIVPHIMAGFGGGSKIALPGVASYETVLALHSPRKGTGGKTVSGMGAIKDNPRRKDIDEAAKIAGLDMKIDVLVNMWGETAEIYAGQPEVEYAAALAAAKKHYLTPRAQDMDVVIANSFAKASEAVSCLAVALPSVGKGGDVVLIANAPDGQAIHYLMGPFGNDIGGKLQLRMKIPDNVNRLIIYNEYPELSLARYLESSSKLVMTDDWKKVMALVKENRGAGTKAAVYPNADIQYFG